MTPFTPDELSSLIRPMSESAYLCVQKLIADLAAARADAARYRWLRRDVPFMAAAADAVEEAARLREELAAARADAARYRWLRGNAPSESSRWARWSIERWDGVWTPMHGDELDAAIDAALAKEKA